MVVHTHHLLGTTEKRTKEKEGGENTIAKKSSPTWTDRKLRKKEDNICVTRTKVFFTQMRRKLEVL